MIVRERIIFDRLPAIIDWYGYEVWQEDEKLFWYDSQAHPDDPELQITSPHHKHIPPDMKHKRIPAPEISFNRSNLEKLINEIESLLKEKNK